MGMIFSTLVLAAASAICAYLWQQSTGQTRPIAGIAALVFGALAALNGLSLIVALGRNLITIAAFLVVGWAVFTIATRR